jgi:GT2 family glycosyltransferase
MIVAIPHHNRSDLLRECLFSIPMKYEVVVKRGGTFARNANWCFARAESRDVLLVNDDAVLSPGAIEAMLAVDADVVVATNVKPTANAVSIEATADGYRVNRLPSMPEAFGAFGIIPHGACVLFRAHLGGLRKFDERFQNGWEDVDLYLRLKSLGYKIAPSAGTFIHEEMSSAGRLDHIRENRRLFVELWPTERFERHESEARLSKKPSDP